MKQTIHTKQATGFSLLKHIAANPLLADFFVSGELALTLQHGTESIEKAEMCTPVEFNAGELAVWLTSAFEVTLIKIGNNLLEAQFEKLRIRLFMHPYTLLNQPETIRGIKVASPEDVAAMSLQKMLTGQAIHSPELIRLRNRFSSKQLFGFYQAKYPETKPDSLEALKNNLVFT